MPLQHIYAANRRAIGIGYPSGGSDIGLQSLDSACVEHQPIEASTVHYPIVEVQKAQIILEILHHKHIQQVDLIAHSEGCINGLIAAGLAPKQFRNIVLMEPAGLLGADTTAALMMRLMKSLAQDSLAFIQHRRERGPLGVSGREAIKYFVRNPRGSLLEAHAIATVTLTEVVRLLHSTDIGIAIIQGVDDRLFPMQRMIAVLRENRAMIAGFYAVKGGHTKLLTDPPYIRLALNALAGLERRQHATVVAG